MWEIAEIWCNYEKWIGSHSASPRTLGNGEIWGSPGNYLVAFNVKLWNVESEKLPPRHSWVSETTVICGLLFYVGMQWSLHGRLLIADGKSEHLCRDVDNPRSQVSKNNWCIIPMNRTQVSKNTWIEPTCNLFLEFSLFLLHHSFCLGQHVFRSDIFLAKMSKVVHPGKRYFYFHAHWKPIDMMSCAIIFLQNWK